MPHTIDLAGDPGFIHVVLHGSLDLPIVDRVRAEFDRPAFFQEIGVYRGMPVERFAEPEAAIRWLSESEATA